MYVKEGEIERIITLLSRTNDIEKCMNICKDILGLLVNGLFDFIQVDVFRIFSYI